jgi:hypothetical protein
MPCHGRKGALAIGGGTAAAMAIVTSALMSDHQNYISRNTLTGYFCCHKNKLKKTLCRDIDEESGHLVTLLKEIYFILFWRKIIKRRH